MNTPDNVRYFIDIEMQYTFNKNIGKRSFRSIA